MPTFESTRIKHCTIFRNNVMAENNNLTTPGNSTTAEAPWGVGVELVATYGDLVENNTIAGNANNGVLGFEFPNGSPVPTPFQLVGNRVVANKFSDNGTAPGSFAGDVTLEGGVFGESVNNCLVSNHFTSATFPESIESGWGCQHKTTPSPGGEAFEYIIGLSAQAQGRTQEGQPAPPAQPTMPNACAGVPKNPLCAKTG